MTQITADSIPAREHCASSIVAFVPNLKFQSQIHDLSRSITTYLYLGLGSMGFHLRPQ